MVFNVRHATGRAKPMLVGCLIAWCSGTPAQDTTVRETEYRERVSVDLVQMEVTVWPKSGEPEQCLGLGKEDFCVSVNGRHREVVAADWIGSPELIEQFDEVEVTDPANPPVTLVLFFDLWHLNVFFRGTICPMTKPLAFDEARRLVREAFRPGDRLLLVTFAGWPRVHSDWIRDPDEALYALDRLETSGFVVSARQQHSHEHRLVEGMKSLLLALGRYPGRKDVIYMADDFRFRDASTRILEIAARAQSNGVALNAVDLIADCRGVDCGAGGLACTPFRYPLGLSTIAVNSGGDLYRRPDIVESVRRIRTSRSCRYLLSFSSPPKEESKSTPLALVRMSRKGLTVRAPGSFQNPARPPREREELDALFLLPLFGEGLIAEIGLWPLRPNGKKRRWNALMLARLSRAPEAEWPDDLEQIVVEAVAHRGGRIYGEFRSELSGATLDKLRRAGGSHLMVFPVDDVRPGDTTVALRASTATDGVNANVRSHVTVPDPPRLGESGPWFLADRLARIGSAITVVPALDGRLVAPREGLMVGYGCRDPDSEVPLQGKVVSIRDDTEASIPIEPMEQDAGSECGWWVGHVGHALSEGLWRFEPPESLSQNRPDPVDFRVSTALPGQADGPVPAGP